VYVEMPASLRMSEVNRQRVAQNLRLAEQLGAQIVTLSGASAAQETLRYARAHNVTKIVIGKPTHPRWRDLFVPSFLEEMVRGSGEIDVYVISGGDNEAAPPKGAAPPQERPATLQGYGASVIAVVLATAISWVTFEHRQLADVVMVYLLGIIVVAMRYGYGQSMLAAVLSVAAVDFFFVPPYFSFAVTDFQHVIMFGVMLVVGAVISSLTQRIRDQAASARSREQRTASLYAMTRELAVTRAASNLSAVAVVHLHEVFDAKVAILLPGTDGRLANRATGEYAFEPDAKEQGVTSWVWTHEKPAGLSTDTLPGSKALYVPLRNVRGRVGVVGILPQDRHRFVDPDQRSMLDVFATQIASALDRARLAEEAQDAQVQMQAERLRSALLSSVSHDLRTPLAVITGSASALVQKDAVLSADARQDLAVTIHEEAERLNRLVRNLLDMTKITSGAMKVAKDWQPLEGVVGAALGRMEDALARWKVEVDLSKDLPLVPIDAVLVEQVLLNILENATKYTPAGSVIELDARYDKPNVVVSIADRGPGVPPPLLDKIFEKFYRLPHEREGDGAGLGLAICRGIVEAHGGRIWAENRTGGGATFSFTIPIDGAPPTVAIEAAGKEDGAPESADGPRAAGDAAAVGGVAEKETAT
jgi:two-component system sensor histidine kinase KdpD